MSAAADTRPVAVLGAGTLGRRIALMFAAGGTPVRLYNRTAAKAEEAAQDCAAQVEDVRRDLGLDGGPAARVEPVADLATAVNGAWLVVESVAEKIELKRRVFAELDGLVGEDVILATNSSSYASSYLADSVRRPERLLNIHFLMPPQYNSVELMSCGRTGPEVIAGLMDRLPRYGLDPFHVRTESVGFIFNRIWAAIKRETLMVLDEGVASPQEIDRIFANTFGSPAGPCRMMDLVGLDVVLDIEEHYAKVRPDVPESPRRLLREYVHRGALGAKTGSGLYDDYGET